MMAMLSYHYYHYLDIASTQQGCDLTGTMVSKRNHPQMAIQIGV